MALEILDEIIQNVEIICSTPGSSAIFIELVHHYKSKGLKIHDFEIISIGLANGINKVATFNVNDFKSVKEISLVEL